MSKSGFLERAFRLCFALTLLPFFACATPYQKLGFGGGYSDTQIDSNTFRVEFKANKYTPLATVRNYLFYRCAELTAEAGYDYFVIEGDNSGPGQNGFSTPGTNNSTTTGSAIETGNTLSEIATTMGKYIPVPAFHSTGDGASTVIKVFKGKPSGNLTAYNANAVLLYMEFPTEVRRGTPGTKKNAARPPP